MRSVTRPAALARPRSPGWERTPLLQEEAGRHKPRGGATRGLTQPCPGSGWATGGAAGTCAGTRRPRVGRRRASAICPPPRAPTLLAQIHLKFSGRVEVVRPGRGEGSVVWKIRRRRSNRTSILTARAGPSHAVWWAHLPPDARTHTASERRLGVLVVHGSSGGGEARSFRHAAAMQSGVVIDLLPPRARLAAAPIPQIHRYRPRSEGSICE
jgi:hypothetical protein